MATFSIGAHLPPSQHLRNLAVHSPLDFGLRAVEIESSLSYRSLFGSSSSASTIRLPPRLLRDTVLARAEDKAKTPSSSFQSLQAQKSSENYFQVLLLHNIVLRLLVPLFDGF